LWRTLRTSSHRRVRICSGTQTCPGTRYPNSSCEGSRACSPQARSPPY
jgi:hypothetical protein